MTDIIETHGPQGNAMPPPGKRPWKAPRLIDLDEADGAPNMMATENDKLHRPAEELRTIGGSQFHFGAS